MHISAIAPARSKSLLEMTDVDVRVAGKRKISAISLAFIVFSEPTLLTANHGLLPAAVVLFISWILLIGVPRNMISWWVLLPILFVGMAGASATWSILPSETTAGAAASLLVLLTAVVAASKIDTHHLVQGVAGGAFAVLLLSVVMAAIRPDLGLVAETYNYGSLRGIYEHRNQMGYTLTVGVVALLSSSVAWSAEKRFVSLGTLLLLVMGVGWSASSTAIAMTVFTFILVLGIRSVPRSAKRLRPLIVTYHALVAGFGLWFLLNQFGAATSLLGRDETLTGRTTIWPYVIEAWTHSRWLGFGWDATWLDASYVGQWISDQIDYRVYHAHDSYLDVLIQLGVVGLLIFASCVLVAVLRSGLRLRGVISGTIEIHKLFLPAVVCVLALYSIVETRISQPLGLYLLFYVLIITNDQRRDSAKQLRRNTAGAG